MKLIFLFLFLLTFFRVNAQAPVGAIELPHMNILYRGYNNKVRVAVTHDNGAEIQVTGVNMTVKESDDCSYYIVKPGKGKRADLTINLIKGDSIQHVHTMSYHVSNLPDPTLYWGAAKNGMKASLHETRIFAKYPPEIPLRAQFAIRKWKVSHKGDTISGIGSNISKAREIFKKLEGNARITFEVSVIGPDGVERQLIGHWIAGKWTDKPEEIKVFRCG